MERLPEVIQNKIMYLTLSHPIVDIIKNTEWFNTLKRRAEQPYSEQEIKEILDDEFDEFDEIVKGECFNVVMSWTLKNLIFVVTVFFLI